MSLGSGTNIRDPEYLFRTPDPGANKAPDPGSATLLTALRYYEKKANEKISVNQTESRSGYKCRLAMEFKGTKDTHSDYSTRYRYIRTSVADPDPLVRGMDPDPSIIKQK
jgi:hypothetical protein